MHFAACALLLHGDQKCNTEIENWNYETRNFDFRREKLRVLLYVLCCCMGSNSATLKSKIGRNSAFRIPLHVLCCCMVIKSATPKSEIGNYEIRNSNFYRERPHVSLHVLCCRMGSNSITLKLEIWRNSAFRMGSNSKTLKLETGRNYAFRIPLYVLYCCMAIKM